MEQGYKVQIPSTKKRKLSAVVHDPPQGVSNKLVVLLPGFLDSKDYQHLVQLSKVLAENGFTCVRFDPTGTWESEGEIVDYTISQYLRDIQAVIDFMSERASFKKIIIVGHSLGGALSIVFAVVGDSVSAVVNIMGSTFVSFENFEEMVVNWSKEGVKMSTRDLPDNKEQSIEFKVPYSFIEDSLKYDVFDIVGELTQPLLIVAGKRDDKVSPEHLREVFEKVKKPKQFVVLEGVDHDYRFSDKGIAAVNKQVIEFLEKHV